MEEQLQPQPVQSRGVSAIHIVLVILMFATLGGTVYLGWQMQSQTAMSEKAATADDEAAELRTELAESQRMLAEEKAKAPAGGDVVIYENAAEGFRVVTARGCEGVYTVRPGQAMPELQATARWDIFVPGSADWATNPIRAFLKIDAEELGFLQEDPANQNRPEVHQLDDASSIRLLTDPRPGVAPRLYEFLRGDGPSTEEIKSADGTGVCPYILQTIPRVMPEAG